MEQAHRVKWVDAGREPQCQGAVAMLRTWWAVRDRQRFFTYAGTRQHLKRPRVLIGSWKRRMALRPDIRPATKIVKTESITYFTNHAEPCYVS